MEAGTEYGNTHPDLLLTPFTISPIIHLITFVEHTAILLQLMVLLQILSLLNMIIMDTDKPGHSLPLENLTFAQKVPHYCSIISSNIFYQQAQLFLLIFTQFCSNSCDTTLIRLAALQGRFQDWCLCVSAKIDLYLAVGSWWHFRSVPI
jgi:hypothetical protein